MAVPDMALRSRKAAGSTPPSPIAVGRRVTNLARDIRFVANVTLLLIDVV